MKKTLILVAIILMSACVAETVERRRPRKGPIKEVGFVDFGGWRVRYSMDGWSWFVSGRRRHALRLMRKNCGKSLAPQVLDEYVHQDADIAYAGEDISTNLDKGLEHFKIAPYDHLIYECRPRGATVETPRISTAIPSAILVVPPVSVISTSTLTEAPAVSTVTVLQESAK